MLKVNKKIFYLPAIISMLVIAIFGQAKEEFFGVKLAFGYGGGASANSCTFMLPSTGGFSVFINNGSAETDLRIVKLVLDGGQDAVGMAISNFSDFRWASHEPYQETKKWTLTENEGKKNVYIKFYNQCGQSSDIVSDSIIFVVSSIETISETQKTDTNNDGIVDIIDFNSLMINWGAEGENRSGDFDNNGIVDIFDFNILMIDWRVALE